MALSGHMTVVDPNAMTAMWERDYHLVNRRITETKDAHCPSVLKFTNQPSAAAQSMLEALQASSLRGFQRSTVATRTIFRDPLHCREKHEQKTVFCSRRLKKEEPHPGLQP